jgi:transcriptional regulator with XRE-family HTH domain
MSVFVDSCEHRLIRGDWREKLIALRSDRKITREQLRKAIGAKPDKSLMWEKGLKSLSESELKAWAAALGATAQLVFERV